MIRGELAIAADLRAAKLHMRVALSRVVIFQYASRCRIRGSGPFVGCGFDVRRTSHSVAVQERLAPQFLILEVIGLGRVGPHCIAAYRSHCLRRSARPDPTRLIRPRGTVSATSPVQLPTFARPADKANSVRVVGQRGFHQARLGPGVLADQPHQALLAANLLYHLCRQVPDAGDLDDRPRLQKPAPCRDRRNSGGWAKLHVDWRRRVDELAESELTVR